MSYAYGDIRPLNHQLVPFGRDWEVCSKKWWEVGNLPKQMRGGRLT